jgi:hypothetical protein
MENCQRLVAGWAGQTIAAPRNKSQAAARIECGNLIYGVSGFSFQVSSFQFVA